MTIRGMTIWKSALVTALALAQAPLLATTLVDGGFEAKGAGLPVNSYCYDNVFAGDGLCVASPWVNLAGNSGVIKSGTGAWGGVAATEGSYFGFIQVTGVLAQSFTATENGTATISWQDTNRPGYGGLQNYVVSVFDGMTSVNIGSFGTLVGPWVARTSASFALTNGTTYSLRFSGLAQSDSTAFIDTIALSVTPANVPEPASWAMLITGFGLIGATLRRRRAAIV